MGAGGREREGGRLMTATARPLSLRLLVCGDRNWSDYETIFNTIVYLGKVDVMIVGDATGADDLARRAAKALGIFTYPPFVAEWGIYGKGAGPIRNRRMIEEGKPNLIVAFHNDLSNSKGTQNTVELARKFGIPVKLVKSPRGSPP